MTHANHKDKIEDISIQPELTLTRILTQPSTFALIRTMVATKVYEAWTDLLIQTGAMSQPPPFDIAALDPTPSDATQRALELAQQLVEPSIVNHMIRTYYFAMAINAWKGKIKIKSHLIDDNEKSDEEEEFDREAFWVACVLHDIGVSDELTPTIAEGEPVSEEITPETNFEVRGGTRAHAFVTQDLTPPFSQKRAWLVHEAIALHTSIVEHGDSKGTLGLQWAAMLFDGAATDLTAMKLGKLAPGTVATVLQKHPKLDFHTLFPEKLRKECAARPCCLITQTAKIGLFEIMEKSGATFVKYESSSSS
uniref:HD domain-containing protein n=1 Tax=Ditylum brightwellii TaxID=49249 RepID=A0A7S4T322_9STRA|mmetsp:Transcript_60962/g.90411  ORF Transcript_60962/g.90411 Transcript_60962/m.90411 type:complete len:308 (+) Transcript_60962:108-1031(+)